MKSLALQVSAALILMSSAAFSQGFFDSLTEWGTPGLLYGPVPNDTYIVNIDGDSTEDYTLDIFFVREGEIPGPLITINTPVTGVPDDITREILYAELLPGPSSLSITKHFDLTRVGDTTFIIDLKRRSNISDIFIFCSDDNIRIETFKLPASWGPFYVIDTDPKDSLDEEPDGPETTTTGGGSTLEISLALGTQLFSFSVPIATGWTDHTLSWTLPFAPSLWIKHAPTPIGRTARILNGDSQNSSTANDPAMNVTGVNYDPRWN